MSVQVLIPAEYPEVDFVIQRELLDRAHVDVETQPDGARLLTFPDGWLPVAHYAKYDWVTADAEVTAANGAAAPSRFSFDKGWLQSESTD